MFPQREANDPPGSLGLWRIRVDGLYEDLLTKTIMRGNDYAVHNPQYQGLQDVCGRVCMHSAVSGVVPKVVATMTGSDQVSVLTELLPSAPLSSALALSTVKFASCPAQPKVLYSCSTTSQSSSGI